MEDAEVALAVQGIGAGDRLRADQAGAGEHPGAGLADAGGHGHLVHEARQVRGDRRLGPLVEVEGVLGDAAQVFRTESAGGKQAGEEGGVAAALGEVRKPDVAPGAHEPAAVAGIDDLDGHTVRIGEEVVEARAAPDRLQSHGVSAVLRVEPSFVSAPTPQPAPTTGA